MMGFLAPKRGECILELGCGRCEDLERVLRLHAGVRMVGMEKSEEMFGGARQRLARHIRRGRLELVVGDVGERLPFPSRHFDTVLSAELLECLPPVKRARHLKEIHRVLRPHGRAIVEHTDWDSQIWNAKDKALARKLIHAFCDWKQGWMEASDGWMGRRLLGVFRRSKLFRELRVVAYVLTNDRYKRGTYGYARARDLLTLATTKRGIRPEEARRFLQDLRAHDRRESYFYSVTRYYVMGKRV